MEFFQNALQTEWIWKRRPFVFVWPENVLETELLDNDDVTIIMWFPWRSPPQWLVIVALSNFSGVLWKENIWGVFRVTPTFSNSPGVVWTEPKFCSCEGKKAWLKGLFSPAHIGGISKDVDALRWFKERPLW